MRSFLRNTFLNFAGNFTRPRKGIHILNSHYIAPDNSDPEVFYNQLKQLQCNVTFINIKEAVELISNKNNVDDPLVAFTFDDGFKECYTSIAPVLNSYNISAAFFINPNFIDGDFKYKFEFLKRVNSNKEPMVWSDIRELKEMGHCIGAHTMDHINLGDVNLDNKELEYQLGTCKEVIEQKLITNCDMFAFPFGLKQHLSYKALEKAEKYYKFIFSGTDYENYYSFKGRVINRRHSEPFWPVSHLNYFLSKEKKY